MVFGWWERGLESYVGVEGGGDGEDDAVGGYDGVSRCGDGAVVGGLSDGCNWSGEEDAVGVEGGSEVLGELLVAGAVAEVLSAVLCVRAHVDEACAAFNVVKEEEGAHLGGLDA